MMDSRIFYKLETKRNSIENEIELYDEQIRDFRELAKMHPKGSKERQELLIKANEIQNYDVYKILKTELQTMNFCINTVFYS